MFKAVISDDLKKRAGTMKFETNEDVVKEMASNLVASGFGQSMLAKGDRVVSVHGMVQVESTIKGQKEPIKYLAVVVKTDKGVEKIAAFSSLLRRKPNAEANHGIFAEDRFAKAVNYVDVYNALIENPNFQVVDVLRNQEFTFGKASVYETGR